MIQHFLEVWLFLVTAFAIGCVVGATVYLALAATFLASLQVALARTVRYGIDGVLERLGAAPAWREYPYVPTDAAPARYEDGGEQSGRREAGVALTPDFPTSRDDHGRDDLSLTRPALRAPAERGPTPMRPMALSRPRNGVPNNLQRIRGIGRKTERRLNEMGIFHFGQIAAWTPGEVRWISELLDYPDRIERDDWIGQAVVLASDDAADAERGLFGDRRDRLFRDPDEDLEGEVVPEPDDETYAYAPDTRGGGLADDDAYNAGEAYDAGEAYEEADPDEPFEGEEAYGPPASDTHDVPEDVDEAASQPDDPDDPRDPDIEGDSDDDAVLSEPDDGDDVSDETQGHRDDNDEGSRDDEEATGPPTGVDSVEAPTSEQDDGDPVDPQDSAVGPEPDDEPDNVEPDIRESDIQASGGEDSDPADDEIPEVGGDQVDEPDDDAEPRRD